MIKVNCIHTELAGFDTVCLIRRGIFGGKKVCLVACGLPCSLQVERGRPMFASTPPPPTPNQRIGMTTAEAQKGFAAVARKLAAELPSLKDIAESMRNQITPIPMILFCPNCGTRHIDAPIAEGWANPPHRSHLCAHCGTVWRPADVPTTGVACIQTFGKKDTVKFTETP